MKSLIVIANLGQVRVLKLRPAGDDPLQQEHLFEITSGNGKEPPKAIHEVVTDQSGRFGEGNAAGMRTGMSNGEHLKLEAELQRTAMLKIASQIGEAVEAEGSPSWMLVAPSTIISGLKKSLSSKAQKTLGETYAADLTRTPLRELEGRFLARR
ncbi:host attachment protein [Luteolibacter luteus]|uniref:Host attachment protein n=1 Tax=Luteolibacter luteus TaxID=2728835 RepID=A0A858RFJ7_9BACT|nr:host attachment protein [Luteolibacter luteus]QJE95328.1 host attachment protein [Luteolibacter luteus]